MSQYGHVRLVVNVDEMAMKLLVADVASRIRNDATTGSEESAVRQVLEAALEAGWRPPA